MVVNGKPVALIHPQILQDFLIEQGYRPQRVVTERNGEIVPRDAVEKVMLEDNDVLEIITFMGGG